MNLAPNIYRPGVVCGFALGLTDGLTPTLSMGALFAQETLWLPDSPPTCPAVPISSRRVLGYNSTAGLYWTTSATGDNTGDAILGWAETNATKLVAVSNQVLSTSSSSTSSSSSSSSTTGTSSVSAINLSCEEVPTGAMNGVNVVFTLVSVPVTNSLIVTLNGILQCPGVDYALTTNSIAFAVAPKTADWLQAWYQASA